MLVAEPVTLPPFTSWPKVTVIISPVKSTAPAPNLNSSEVAAPKSIVFVAATLSLGSNAASVTKPFVNVNVYTSLRSVAVSNANVTLSLQVKLCLKLLRRMDQ